jgi:hypothetical protein
LSAPAEDTLQQPRHRHKKEEISEALEESFANIDVVRKEEEDPEKEDPEKPEDPEDPEKEDPEDSEDPEKESKRESGRTREEDEEWSYRVSVTLIKLIFLSKITIICLIMDLLLKGRTSN